MKMTQAIKMALKSIKKNKIRTALTMLGIIIGVFTVTLMITLVQGATESITSEMSSLGTKAITVNITNPEKGILEQDLDDLIDCKEIKDTSPICEGSLNVIINNNTYDAKIIGIEDDFFPINDINICSGRKLSSLDVKNRLPVCVVSYELIQKAYKQKKQSDYVILIDGIKYRVVGLLEEQDSFLDENNLVYVPYSSAKRLLKQQTLLKFQVVMENDKDVENVEKIVDRFMNNKIGDDYYSISNMKSFIDAISSVYKALEYLLAGIASISLIVGGIGIMNIMLVSVIERTHEIGIRKAIGAKNTDIVVQFLTEAIVISLIGGLFGIFLSLGVVDVLDELVSDISFSISWKIGLLAISFSAIVGIIFGIYPAQKAAKLKPIEALRNR